MLNKRSIMARSSFVRIWSRFERGQTPPIRHARARPAHRSPRGKRLELTRCVRPLILGSRPRMTTHRAGAIDRPVMAERPA
jgi:hypothetical protein